MQTESLMKSEITTEIRNHLRNGKSALKSEINILNQKSIMKSEINYEIKCHVGNQLFNSKSTFEIRNQI